MVVSNSILSIPKYMKPIKFDTCLSAKKQFLQKLTRMSPGSKHWKNCCWVWLGGRIPFSYNGNPIEPISFSYLAFKGPVFDMDKFKHLCRNKSCVNPNHIRKVRIDAKKKGKKIIIQPSDNRYKYSLSDYGDFDHDAFWNQTRQEGYHLISKLKRYIVNGHGVSPLKLAYMLKYGDIPKGHSIVRECEHPNCIDPLHCTLQPYRPKR
jgi:hypothetical protein